MLNPAHRHAPEGEAALRSLTNLGVGKETSAMDGSQFDQWARTLVSRTDRRRVLQGVSGLDAALLGTSLSMEMTDAKGSKRRTHRARRVKQEARGNKGPDACAVRCAAEPKARGAQCRLICKTCKDGPAGTCYNDTTGAFLCKEITVDSDNCGGCGEICPDSTPSCADGACCVAKGESCSGSSPCCGAENACVAGTCATCLPILAICYQSGGCCAGLECRVLGPNPDDVRCVPQP
jgi:hypothetical protein